MNLEFGSSGPKPAVETHGDQNKKRSAMKAEKKKQASAYYAYYDTRTGTITTTSAHFPPQEDAPDQPASQETTKKPQKP